VVRADIEQLLGRVRGATRALAEAWQDKWRKRATGTPQGRAPHAGRRPRAARGPTALAARPGSGPPSRSSAYEDLTAAQVVSSLNDLTPARAAQGAPYERRNANRKSVLNAVRMKLA
jgi:hypothetical protein